MTLMISDVYAWDVPMVLCVCAVVFRLAQD